MFFDTLSKFSACEVKHFAMVVWFMNLRSTKRFVVTIKVTQRNRGRTKMSKCSQLNAKEKGILAGG